MFRILSIRVIASYPHFTLREQNGVRAYSEIRQRVRTQRRFRQHVNPLAGHFKSMRASPNWNDLQDLSLPIHLDIGCARGEYLMQIAKAYETKLNFIGVEIRQNVVQYAQSIASQFDLTNLIFVHANINYQLHTILENMPNKLQSISIFHPDPWLKRSHHKRRVITPEFADALAEYLDPTIPIYVQTDVLDLSNSMHSVFMDSNRYVTSLMQENAFSIASDREKYVLKVGGSIYRTRYNVIKKDNKDYKSQAYWNERFECEESYDWLASYHNVGEELGRYIDESDRILMVGCGNSTFSADLYKAGYKNITNLDFSQIVIDRMREKHAKCAPEMEWICGDMTKLTDTFDANTFDVVVDKAAMDAIMVDVADSWNPPEANISQAAAMCTSIHKALKETGVFIQISFAQPHFRKRFLMGDDLERSTNVYSWTFDYHPIGTMFLIAQWQYSLTIVLDTDVGLGYFMYVMKKTSVA
uniref:tRNA (guanine(46)-N(7))-methyltransferase n=1 Tax=Albugo laibachii Nc14 TaxID=890382 RepID=F0WBE4_9STRA|nr:conserved hypothetical protein [Albugo laibachii Nc14]|eukprot:CCA18468.1 conserved hypothetical protein [Albugo laibachii Nc14]